MFVPLFPEEDELIRGVISLVKGREKIEVKNGDFFAFRDQTLKQLQEQYPARFQEVLEEITASYNEFVAEAVAKFPLSADAYWQNYRRNQTKASLGVFPDESKTDAENDKLMAKNYNNLLTFMSKNMEEIMGKKFVPLDIEPRLQLLDRQPERLTGIMGYIFKNETGDLTETIWDFREAKIPAFQYRGHK